MAKTTEIFKQAVWKMLWNESEKDPMFYEKLKNENKNMDECCAFIIQEVQKSGCHGFDDSEILNIAKHYWDEENIGDIKDIQCNVIINTHYGLTEEEMARAKEEAKERVIRQEMDRMTRQSPKQVKKTEMQPTLFDL